MNASSASEGAAEHRRGRPGYDRRGILEVAVAVFNEQGYDATSVATLAERLGLGKSAIYHHFSSKEELLRRALDEALDGLEGALRDAIAADVTAGERLQLALTGAVTVLVERLPYVTLLLRVRGNSEVERAALDRRRAFDQELTRLVREAQGEGTIRSDVEAGVATRLLFGMVNSIVEWYRPSGPEDAAKLSADVVAIAMGGLRVAHG
ncbi:TetR/AcrR family transcriptional regulator [Agromyces sp. MMS24-JH15]|uniref:TetR/AcrR family transcriptional regulator n=1 Tax=Agromyces sp. MMS24-JH15 TaxID=3243765 RepID=UPI0037487586